MLKDKEAHNIGFDMLPFVMKELVAMVMKKKTLPLEDALYYVYSSKLYDTLLDEEAKLWYLSTPSLYDMLEKEKTDKRISQGMDMKVLLFKMFCLENYRAVEKLPAKNALLLFSEYDVFSFLDETFEVLHTQDIDYILDTVATYIKNKKEKK